MPTDTQYALSAVATNRDAVAAVFKIKQRPAFENLPILLPSLNWLERVAGQPPERVRGLAERVWPGRCDPDPAQDTRRFTQPRFAARRSPCGFPTIPSRCRSCASSTNR